MHVVHAEESLYEDDTETQVEIQAVRNEYAVDEYTTVDDYKLLVRNCPQAASASKPRE